MWLYAVLLVVVVQRVSELLIARRNTRRLLASGAQEIGAGHYPLIVLLHSAWLLAILVLVSPDAQPDMVLLLFFGALQIVRIWVLISLGPRWTTRVIILKGAPLVAKGPYRWLNHPNYMVVVAEIAILPLAFGAIWIAVAFSILNGLLLWHRVRIENLALNRA